MKRAGLWQDAWAGAEKEWFARTVDLIRPRTRLLHDFFGMGAGFFHGRFRVRAGGAGEILEGRKNSGAARQAYGCACSSAGLEP